MSMETTAWTQLHSVMNAEQERRPFARATLRRIAAFARPHRVRIAQFVALGVVTALLAVATPVLAGHVVDAIVSGGDEERSYTWPCSSHSSRSWRRPSAFSAGGFRRRSGRG